MRILPTPIGLSRSATYDGQRCLFRHYSDSVLEATQVEKPKDSPAGDVNGKNSDAERALADIIKSQKGGGVVIDRGKPQGGTRSPEAPKGVTTPPNNPAKNTPNKPPFPRADEPEVFPE